MKPYEKSDLFSLAARRRLEDERAGRRREALSHAKRVVARLASQRRVREIVELVAEAERKMLWRLAGRDFTNFLGQARCALARTVNEDRPATFAAAEDVARSIASDAEGPERRERVEHRKSPDRGTNGISPHEAAE